MDPDLDLHWIRLHWLNGSWSVSGSESGLSLSAGSISGSGLKAFRIHDPEKMHAGSVTPRAQKSRSNFKHIFAISKENFKWPAYQVPMGISPRNTVAKVLISFCRCSKISSSKFRKNSRNSCLMSWNMLFSKRKYTLVYTTKIKTT
jgi:hypothetical protein